MSGSCCGHIHSYKKALCVGPRSNEWWPPPLHLGRGAPGGCDHLRFGFCSYGESPKTIPKNHGIMVFYGVLWCFNGIYPLVNIQKTNGKSPPETMGKSTISKWAIFNSYVLNYQRVGFNTKLIWFWKGTHRKTGKPRFLRMEKRLHGVKVESQSHWKAVQVLDWIHFCNLRCHQRKPPRPTPCFPWFLPAWLNHIHHLIHL